MLKRMDEDNKIIYTQTLKCWLPQILSQGKPWIYN